MEVKINMLPLIKFILYWNIPYGQSSAEILSSCHVTLASCHHPFPTLPRTDWQTTLWLTCMPRRQIKYIQILVYWCTMSLKSSNLSHFPSRPYWRGWRYPQLRRVCGPGGGGSLGAGLVASGPSVLAALTCHGQHSADRHQQGDLLAQSRLTIELEAKVSEDYAKFYNPGLGPSPGWNCLSLMTFSLALQFHV